jgi:hypothetical protein
MTPLSDSEYLTTRVHLENRHKQFVRFSLRNKQSGAIRQISSNFAQRKPVMHGL